MRSAVLMLLCVSMAAAGAIAAEPPALEELVVRAPSAPPPLSLEAMIAADKLEITVSPDELAIAPPSVEPPKPAAVAQPKPAAVASPAASDRSTEPEPVAGGGEADTRG